MKDSESNFYQAEQPKEREIENRLLRQLPQIAHTLILDSPRNKNFQSNPDDPKEHEPKWHQFGIITHTAKLSEHYHQTVPKYLQEWGLNEMVVEKLSEEIDGKTKAELLGISMPLHDLGKFASPCREKSKSESVRNHLGHEEKSAEIINKNSNVRKILIESGLTESQIDYIARCAQTHYELGKMRALADSLGFGFNMAFVKSSECRTACQKIAEKFPELKIEIGIYFLADSLAKTDLVISADSDDEIKAQSDRIKQKIKDLGLNPNLISAVLQSPVNINAAKTYLKQAIR